MNQETGFVLIHIDAVVAAGGPFTTVHKRLFDPWPQPMHPRIGLPRLSSKERRLSWLTRVGLHRVETQEPRLLRRGQGAMFLDAAGAMWTRFALEGQQGSH